MGGKERMGSCERDGDSKVMNGNGIKKKEAKNIKTEPEECSNPLTKCKSSRGM